MSSSRALAWNRRTCRPDSDGQLRSETPDGVVQEVWALLCACHAVRELISAAAALAGQDPLRICFASALDVVRGPVGNAGPFSPSPG